MPTIEELNRLRQKVETLKAESARAEGALGQVMQRLKVEFGCDSIEQAETKLKTLTKDADRAESEFTEAYDDFLKQHPDLAEGH